MIDERLKEIFLEITGIEGLSCNENSISEYIKSFLLKNNFNPHEDESYIKSKSNTGNIICPIGNGGEIILTAHMDTARSTGNVKPILKDDRIVSDGTTVLGVDNRVGITLLLCLAEMINKNYLETEDFTIAFTTCEETTLAGSKNIELNGSTKMGFVFDSYLRPGQFVNESYGAASFKIKIFGKAAHSGIAPGEGINSLQIAADAITLLKLGQYDQKTTLNIGKIMGGSAVNVVPELTQLEGEIRSTTIENVNKCYQTVKTIFEKSAGKYSGTADFKFIWDFQPYKLDENSPVVKRITETIRRVGLDPVQAISRGGSDANSFNERGIESVNIGIGAQNPHSNDEFILYEDFNNAFKIAVELVRKK